jgi:hypothetical protein
VIMITFGGKCTDLFELSPIQDIGQVHKLFGLKYDYEERSEVKLNTIITSGLRVTS